MVVRQGLRFIAIIQEEYYLESNINTVEPFHNSYLGEESGHRKEV